MNLPTWPTFFLYRPAKLAYDKAAAWSGATTTFVKRAGFSLMSSLAVHDTYRRIATPYYGHGAGMPWSNDGEVLNWRSYMWASGVGAQ